jgi:plastocyanin
MNASRRTARVLLTWALCAACALAGPALVAGAAGEHGRHGKSAAASGRHGKSAAARRSDACPRRRHRRGCRATSKRAPRAGRRRHARDPGHVTGSTGAGASTPASSGGAVTAPSGPTTAAGAAGGSGGSSPTGSGDQPSGPTAVPPVEPPTEGPVRVQVIAKEYSFTLSRAEVPAGKVIVEFVNGGEDSHNLHFQEPSEATEAGAFPTSAPGFHGNLTLNLHPGSYTLFCSLPGHEAKGMKATLIVR